MLRQESVVVVDELLLDEKSGVEDSAAAGPFLNPGQELLRVGQRHLWILVIQGQQQVRWIIEGIHDLQEVIRLDSRIARPQEMVRAIEQAVVDRRLPTDRASLVDHSEPFRRLVDDCQKSELLDGIPVLNIVKMRQIDDDWIELHDHLPRPALE